MKVPDPGRQWVITGYTLTIGSLLLGGRLGDLFGRKVTFLTGLLTGPVAGQAFLELPAGLTATFPPIP
jgi:MFS family permease